MILKLLTFVALLFVSFGFQLFPFRFGAFKGKQSLSIKITDAAQLGASKLINGNHDITNMLTCKADEVYHSVFGELMPSKQVKSIVRRQGTNHKAVDLNITKALAGVLEVLPQPARSPHKGPVAVVRGPGGGKTLAMVHLLRGLQNIAPEHKLLPILITFNEQWEINNEVHYSRLRLTDPWDVFGLAVVVRIASLYFEITIDSAMDMMNQLSAAEFLAAFPEGTAQGQIIAHFLMYLVRREGKNKVVLMVDETVRADEYMASLFERFSAAEQIRSSMLRFKYAAHGMQGALVISGLEGYVAGKTDGKVIYPFVLSEELNATAVMEHMFLTQIDTTDIEHKIVPRLHERVCNDAAKSERLARDVLIYRARLFGVCAVGTALPRGSSRRGAHIGRHSGAGERRVERCNGQFRRQV